MGNKPRIRFKGFTEDWEQRKFGELFTLKSGVAFKLSEYTKTGIPIINGESIKAGEISLEKVNYLPSEYQYKYQECLLFPGDIVLGLNRPIINGALKISRIPSAIKTSLLYQRAGKIIFKVNMEENFTYQLLSKEVLTFTRKEAVGSDQPFITTTKLNKWDLRFPVKDEERRKIGNLFDNINNIITLHQCKLEKLKLTKKALLQKLFPKNGKHIPEIRFKGFTDAWEQRKLTSFIQRVKGNDGRMDLPTLTISASEGWLNQKDRFSANIAGSEQKNYTLLRQGELSYNHGNSKLAKYGVVYVLKDYKEALVPRVYHSFKVDESYDALFVEYYFSTKRPDRELAKLVSSGARMDGLLNIGYDEFANISIAVPTFSEQRQIVALLRRFDKFITLHQRKLERLQEVKKGLLQKMFV